MATDLALMTKNLLSFYDFTGRVVISVGAGGGQLVEYGRAARKVIAIDSDPAALEKLQQSLDKKGLTPTFELICEDFFTSSALRDVVLFEFSLHELSDPALALQLSNSMAPDTLVFDHSPGSQWAYYVAEEDKVRTSWNAIESRPVRRCIHYDTIQRFVTYEELYEKGKSQGQITLDRIRCFESARDFVIPMKYGLALL